MGRIVAYGDAIASGIAFANPSTINAGGVACGLVSGSRAPTSVIERGDHVIVSLGWNDINAVFGEQPFIAPAMYERRMAALLQEIRNRNGGASISLLGLEPLTTRYPGITNAQVLPMNLLLEQVAHKARVHFVDLAANPVGHRTADGLLYHRAGYQQLVARAGHVVEHGGLPLHMPLRPIMRPATARPVPPRTPPPRQ